MDDYIDRVTRIEIRIMKRADAEKRKKVASKALVAKKSKAA